MVACSITSPSGIPMTRSGYTALLEKAEPKPLRAMPIIAAGMLFRPLSKPSPPIPKAPPLKGPSSTKVSARKAKPSAVTLLKTRVLAGKRSTSQPRGTEMSVYTIDEPMKTSETLTEESLKGAELSLYVSVGSRVATIVPESATESRPSTTETLSTALTGAAFAAPGPLSVLRYSLGMKNGVGGSSSSGKSPHSRNGSRKAHDGGGKSLSGMMSCTPPMTGPTMQPMPETVPMDAITIANLSSNFFETMMMHAVSARAPVRPLMKYDERNRNLSSSRFVVPSSVARSGARPKKRVKIAVSSKPDVTASRVPVRWMSCGAKSEVSAMPVGYAAKMSPLNVPEMPSCVATGVKKEERKVAMQ
mmetsp:Transcript_14648/g.33461  ORF Transcript_14648/g.33461 Transcript_14648/m.33461 type:complete len:360 (+) Transcript_14648:980-2059(+)